MVLLLLTYKNSRKAFKYFIIYIISNYLSIYSLPFLLILIILYYFKILINNDNLKKRFFNIT